MNLHWVAVLTFDFLYLMRNNFKFPSMSVFLFNFTNCQSEIEWNLRNRSSKNLPLWCLYGELISRLNDSTKIRICCAHTKHPHISVISLRHVGNLWFRNCLEIAPYYTIICDSNLPVKLTNFHENLQDCEDCLLKFDFEKNENAAKVMLCFILTSRSVKLYVSFCFQFYKNMCV